MLKGLVYDFERFATHDGPGIRTLVFLKGCPLSCLWCSSPQTQLIDPELIYTASRCQHCGSCAEACLESVITLSKDRTLAIDREHCTGCGLCVKSCSAQALGIAGRWMTVTEVMRVICRDMPYYRRSNGGVTIGGGEPTMQPAFVERILQECKGLYIHTAMETCGHVGREVLGSLLKYIDLLYFDIKHMDALAHKRITGVSNELILSNAKMAAALCPMIIRVPVIPGLNDSDENILDTAVFASGLGSNLQKIELLPYHRLGLETYKQLDRTYSLIGVVPLDESDMKRLRQIVESKGLSAEVGG